jgi:hypothetical protein
MPDQNLPPLQPYAPSTFLERGLAVPFTAPLLFGSRARPAPRGGGIELILPNPTGGRGVYVLAWESVREFCRPTVHDRQLIVRINALPNITPSAIRNVAREVAAEGMAGEEAMEAALATIDASHNELVAANFSLLMAAIHQVERLYPTLPPLTDMERRAQRAVGLIAPRVGHSSTWVANSLEALATVLCNIGIRNTSPDSLVGRTLALLTEVRAEIADWGRRNPGDAMIGYAAMICDVADVTLMLADRTLQNAYTMSDDVIAMLHGFGRDPELINRMAARPEWLLDGWETICLLWRDATRPARRRAVVAEIAVLVPVLPREANEWAGDLIDHDKLSALRRYVPFNEDWRTGGTVFEILARNEHLRSVRI